MTAHSFDNDTVLVVSVERAGISFLGTIRCIELIVLPMKSKVQRRSGDSLNVISTCATRCIAPNALYAKLDAECNRQATVVSKLLRAIDNSWEC